MILGDLMVKGLNEYDLSKNQNVKVQCFSRYITRGTLDIAKPDGRPKLDAVINYGGKMTSHEI